MGVPLGRLMGDVDFSPVLTRSIIARVALSEFKAPTVQEHDHANEMLPVGCSFVALARTEGGMEGENFGAQRAG